MTKIRNTEISSLDISEDRTYELPGLTVTPIARCQCDASFSITYCVFKTNQTYNVKLIGLALDKYLRTETLSWSGNHSILDNG